MDVYEHHFDEERHRDFHDNMLEQIAEKEKVRGTAETETY